MTTQSMVTDERCLGEIDARSDLTEEEFLREYHVPQKPVLLKGHVNDWRAMKEWSFDFFKEKYGHWRLPTGRCFDFKGLMPLGEYCDFAKSTANDPGHVADQDPPLYMEGWYYLRENPKLHCPELSQYYDVPRFFEVDWFESRWFPRALDPRAHGILMAAKGGFTKLHYDQLATHSWNAHVVGRKKWIMIAPDQMDLVYHDIRQSRGYVKGTDVEHPDYDRFPLMRDVRYWQCVAEPGDVIFIPSMWLHEVTSLDPTIGVTHNYLRGNNLAAFTRMFLDYRKELRRKKRDGEPLAVFD